ncbi:MAG: phospholipase [Chlorobi bacterium]|nr:phospholipase [Chlorobiota bacterium]
MEIVAVYPRDKSPAGKIPLFMLHGYGSHEADLYAFKDALPSAYYPVALRAYHPTPYGGYAWYPLYVGPDGRLHADEPAMIEALHRLREDIKNLSDRLGFEKTPSLLGFSQGSILSYLLMSHYPRDFRLITALSGYIHEPLMLPVSEEEARRLRVFASHGIYDDIIPVELARRIPPWLEKHHIPYEYKEYPAGHTVTPENLADATAFLARHAY